MSENAGVKKETTLLFVFIAFVIGFVAGVVYSAYRFDKTITGQSPAQPHDHADTAHIAALEEAVSKDPKNVAAWIELGNLCFDAERIDRAVTAYETAVGLHPENADVWTDLGVMYRKQGKPKEALIAFNKAQAANPAHEASLFNAGVVLMHDLNQPQEARALWGKLIALNPMAKAPSGELVKDLLEKMP